MEFLQEFRLILSTLHTKCLCAMQRTYIKVQFGFNRSSLCPVGPAVAHRICMCVLLVFHRVSSFILCPLASSPLRPTHRWTFMYHLYANVHGTLLLHPLVFDVGLQTMPFTLGIPFFQFTFHWTALTAVYKYSNILPRYLLLRADPESIPEPYVCEPGAS